MSRFLPDLPFSQLEYELPHDHIAAKPLAQRDASKLLVYRGGEIKDSHFYELPDLLPENSLIVGNNTKVIPARLHFTTEENNIIEIFLLEPMNPQWSIWKVMVGGRKKFREGTVLRKSLTMGNSVIDFEARWYHRENNMVFFSAADKISMHEVIESVGKTPLPPYINRDPDEEDALRYQTVFAEIPGAVAAPTAALHFTDELLSVLSGKGLGPVYLTLHVSAGTFKPVTSSSTRDHEMHYERYSLQSDVLRLILERLKMGKPVIPVGTTSMRVLESIYYIGVNLLLGKDMPSDIDSDVGFNPAYCDYSMMEALSAVINEADKRGGTIAGTTSIFILPGFRFRVCSGLITNFHQPGSTLIGLVSAFVGQDWHKIYKHALDTQYRFLSFGDSSLLLPITKD